MMGESMKKVELDKQGLFADYISRYEYKDISKAYEDFEEIFDILEIISYAIRVNRFNGHPRGDLEGEVTTMFKILCDKGVIDSYPFEHYDRYHSFSQQKKGIRMNEYIVPLLIILTIGVWGILSCLWRNLG